MIFLNDGLGGLTPGTVLEEMEQKRGLSESVANEIFGKCLNHFRLKRSELAHLAKSDPRKFLMAGLLRYHYPVKAQWVSEQLVMGHFTTMSRAVRFYDEVEGQWAREKERILTFIS